MKKSIILVLCAVLAAACANGCDKKKGNPPAGISAPASVGATGADGSATIYWSPVAEASSYNIYWSNSPGTDRLSGTAIAGATSPHVHSGLSNGTAYYYVVTALKDANESVESNEASATPSAGASALGVTWSRACSKAPWGPRIGHSAVVFNSRMWVIGGMNWSSGTGFADAWSSADGFNWEEKTSVAAFGARRGHACVAFNGEIWLLGGRAG